jgi:DtxR family transcriptional regulator, Mn-dependent transcriptional regulator
MKILSKSIEDYLEAIFIIESKGQKIHSVEIAELLNISKPAVTKAMNELISLGYIQKKPYEDVTLTDSGRKIAKEIYHKHTTIKKFLISLGVSEETAEHDCCLIEHVVSKETFNKIEQNLNKNGK